jgi:uncharacterized membrane protein
MKIMTLFLAQNHSAMTHLPIASAILAAVAALTALFVRRREISQCCAVLSILALVTVLPAAITGIAAAKGRFNDEGKPYIQSGVLVSNIPANARIFRHQVLGVAGAVVSALLTLLSISTLSGRNPNRYLIALLAVLLALLWGLGGHLGGRNSGVQTLFPPSTCGTNLSGSP